MFRFGVHRKRPLAWSLIAIFCFQSVFGMAPVRPSPMSPVQTGSGKRVSTSEVGTSKVAELSLELRDDLALALLVFGYPNAVGLDHFPTPLPFSQLLHKLMQVKDLSEKWIASHGGMEKEIGLIASYNQLLSHLIHLDSLQNDPTKIRLEDLFLFLDGETIQKWGGEDRIRDLNGFSQTSGYRFTRGKNGGYVVELTESFLAQMKAFNGPHPGKNEEHLLFVGKMAAKDVLIKSLAMIGVLLGKEVEEGEIDSSHLAQLREQRGAIERENRADLTIDSVEIQKMILSRPLVDATLVVDMMEAVYWGESFSVGADGVTDLAEYINAQFEENSELVLNSIQENLVAARPKKGDDWGLSLAKAVDRTRKDILLELFLPLLDLGDSTVKDPAVERLIDLVQEHTFDRYWIDGLPGRLRQSSDWAKLTQAWGGERGLDKLALDLIKSVKKINGDLSVLGDDKEKLKLLMELAAQILGPRRYTQAVALSVRELEGFDDISSARDHFWKSYEKLLQTFDDGIDFKRYSDVSKGFFDVATLVSVIRGVEKERAHDGGKVKREIDHGLLFETKRDLLALLDFAGLLGFDRAEMESPSDQLASYQKTNVPVSVEFTSAPARKVFGKTPLKWVKKSKKLKDLMEFLEINTFPILDLKIEDSKGKKLRFADLIQTLLESKSEEDDEGELISQIKPLLVKALEQIREQIKENLTLIEKAQNLEDLKALFLSSGKMSEMIRPYALPALSRFVWESQTMGPGEKVWEIFMKRYVHFGFTMMLIYHIGSWVLKFSKSFSLASTFLRNAYHSIPRKHLAFFGVSATALFGAEAAVVGHEFFNQKKERAQARDMFSSSVTGEENLFLYEEILQEDLKTRSLAQEFWPLAVMSSAFFFPLFMYFKGVQKGIASLVQKRIVKKAMTIDRHFAVLGFKKSYNGKWNPEVIETTSRMHREKLIDEMRGLFQKIMDQVPRPSYEIKKVYMNGKAHEVVGFHDPLGLTLRSSLIERARRALSSPGRPFKSIMGHREWNDLLAQKFSLENVEKGVKAAMETGKMEKGLGEDILKKVTAYRGHWEQFLDVRRSESALSGLLKKEVRRWRHLNTYHRSDFEKLGLEGGQWWEYQKLTDNYKKVEKAFEEGSLSYRSFFTHKEAFERLTHVYQRASLRLLMRWDLAVWSWRVGMLRVEEGLPLWGPKVKPRLREFVPLDTSQPIPVDVLGKEIRFKKIELKSEGGKEIELTTPYWGKAS
ncbi:MAG: hypothetical protein OXB88_02500 [Bacteriovoracales bacterium]|nr:hypothetical protein [Bacteriovoracales bacterium]